MAPDLTEALLREISTRRPDAAPGAVASPGVLALLSHALDQAWRNHTGDTLTLARVPQLLSDLETQI